SVHLIRCVSGRVNKYSLSVLPTPRPPPISTSVLLLIATASHIANEVSSGISLKPLRVSELAPSLVPAVTVWWLSQDIKLVVPAPGKDSAGFCHASFGFEKESRNDHAGGRNSNITN